jgi:chromosome segregation ATPase
MTEKIKKSAEILRRLRTTNDNLRVLNQLLTEALEKLDDVTRKISDNEMYISSDEVKKNWITREEVKDLLNAKALLEECQNEMSEIDRATKDVEDSLEPIMNKIKPKKINFL